ncbi:hypothetical protein [uncultured Tenacibaculum sp.]|uniref:hypothetical protein n=1 Tax=uncultured Tenacibaculum sp. TaxID=174713 RepID=UPI002603D428|nr:hypothetical protein [uncultured Tenacibaculum sp.]
MITGQSVEEICKEIGENWSTNIYDNLMPYLSNKGFKSRVTKGVDITFDEVPNDSIVLFLYPNEKGHFVLKHDGKYYDPAIGIVEQYLAHRKVTSYLKFEKKEA